MLFGHITVPLALSFGTHRRGILRKRRSIFCSVCRLQDSGFPFHSCFALRTAHPAKRPERQTESLHKSIFRIMLFPALLFTQRLPGTDVFFHRHSHSKYIFRMRKRLLCGIAPTFPCRFSEAIGTSFRSRFRSCREPQRKKHAVPLSVLSVTFPAGVSSVSEDHHICLQIRFPQRWNFLKHRAVETENKCSKSIRM